MNALQVRFSPSPTPPSRRVRLHVCSWGAALFCAIMIGTGPLSLDYALTTVDIICRVCRRLERLLADPRCSQRRSGRAEGRIVSRAPRTSVAIVCTPAASPPKCPTADAGACNCRLGCFYCPSLVRRVASCCPDLAACARLILAADGGHSFSVLGAHLQAGVTIAASWGPFACPVPPGALP